MLVRCRPQHGIRLTFGEGKAFCCQNGHGDVDFLGKIFHRLRHNSGIVGVQHALTFPPYTC